MTALSRPFAPPAPIGIHEQLLVGVDCHTWPERTEVLLTSPKKTPVWIFKLSDDQGAAHDVFAPAAERVADALGQLERDQHWLHRRYEIYDEDVYVRLYERGERGALVEKALRRCGLRPADVELTNLPATLRLLEQLSVDELYRICCVWFREVEQEATLPWNSVSREQSWMRRSHPEIRSHFRSLLCGQGDAGAAYRLFIDLFDVRIEQLTWGVVQRWVYYHRTEFADRPLQPMTALASLGLA